jgi:peptidoglycan hydrolase CwlO-like protein
MTVEVSLLISGISLALAIYLGISNLKRTEKSDAKSDASQMTTVIVKLENIGTGITEIKNEMNNVKNEVKESRERIIKVEESSKQAHKRMDTCEKFCKRFNDSNDAQGG